MVTECDITIHIVVAHCRRLWWPHSSPLGVTLHSPLASPFIAHWRHPSYFPESLLLFISDFSVTLLWSQFDYILDYDGRHPLITSMTPVDYKYDTYCRHPSPFRGSLLILPVISALAVDNGVTPTGCKARAFIIVIRVAYMREKVGLWTRLWTGQSKIHKWLIINS